MTKLRKNVENNKFNDDLKKIKNKEKEIVYVSQLENADISHKVDKPEIISQIKQDETTIKINKHSNNVIDSLKNKFINLKNKKYSLSKILKFLKDNNFSLSNIINSIRDAENLDVEEFKNEQTSMRSVDNATKEELEIGHTSHQEPEDDGLVIIPNIKNKNTDDKEPQFPYEKKVGRVEFRLPILIYLQKLVDDVLLLYKQELL